ncbi:hypothetical protein DMH08_30450 [Actinomadura sp. WAC 06369]|nr:hypothetical protein DMH08_30450 [Actinomadura sp. WAC 06369]
MRAGRRAGAGRGRPAPGDQGEDEPLLCLTCHRVRPALDRTDYTSDRALLILRRGLCACLAPPPPPAWSRTARPSGPDVPRARPRSAARRPPTPGPQGRFAPSVPVDRTDT